MSWDCGIAIDNPLAMDETYNRSAMRVKREKRRPRLILVAGAAGYVASAVAGCCRKARMSPQWSAMRGAAGERLPSGTGSIPEGGE